VTAETQVQSKIVRPILLQFWFQAQQGDHIAYYSVSMQFSLTKTLFLPWSTYLTEIFAFQMIFTASLQVMCYIAMLGILYNKQRGLLQ